MNIVLASSSPYRKQLLERIIAKFECASPDIDESALTNEEPHDLAARLALSKARALAGQFPDSLIVGSDQVAWLEGEQLQKPGNREQNILQLQRSSGKAVTFYTSLCLLNSRTGEHQLCVEQYIVQFRQLKQHQIEYYVDQEKAFNCAGGFKMEGLGISLFEKIQGDDPNVLIGLPLIKLVSMLAEEGVEVLA